MDRDLRRLTLVYPVGADDRIIDFLLDSTPSLPGFTSWRCEGHGASFDESSTREKVRGRIERNMLVMVIERARLAELLADLHAGCAIPDLAYWAERVERFGRFK
jgi:hypothetical protein